MGVAAEVADRRVISTVFKRPGDDHPGGLDLGVTFEPRTDQPAVPRPVVLGVGRAVDAEERAAVAVPRLERGLLLIVEHIARGVQEDDSVVVLEVGPIERSGVFSGGDCEAMPFGELVEAGDAIGDRAVAEAGGFGEHQHVCVLECAGERKKAETLEKSWEIDVRILAWADLSERDTPVRHRPVIALQPQRRERYLTLGPAPCRPDDLDILMDHLTVEPHRFEACVGDFRALRIEPGGAEDDIEFVPFAGGPGRVHPGRDTLEALAPGSSRRVPPLVDPAHVVLLGVCFSVRIEDLDLVPALEIDAGVGALGDHELDVGGDIAVLEGGDEVVCTAVLGDQDRRGHSVQS